MGATIHHVLESKRVDSQAVLMARYFDDICYIDERLKVISAKNGAQYHHWKVTREYIHYLYNAKKILRIKSLIMAQGYTLEQVNIIWDIAHRDNEECYLLLLAAFTEWDKG